jgi:3-oxoadipate enol-lactonase/4-carboxymuconolactone decarboxylase
MLADDVLAVADAAGIGAFSLAGVSLGGMIGMELALRAPDRIAKLALICTSATMDSASWNQRIAKVRSEGMVAIAALAMGRFLSDAASPATYQTILRQLLGMDAEGYAGCGAAIRDMDLAERITGIAAPTLVVTGTRDTSTPFVGHGDHLVTRIPGAAHLSLDAAHLAPLEAGAELATGMIAFLQD